MKNKVTLIAMVAAMFLSNQQNISAQTWSTTGNAGTNTATNFIGTTDAKNFKMRTNNSVRVNITSNGKIGIGNFTPDYKLDVKGGSINTDSIYRIGGYPVLSTNGAANTFVGTNSGISTTTGYNNAATGHMALYINTTGHNNAAHGYMALYNNTTASYNVAIGFKSLYTNTTGYNNTASGYSSLYYNTTGYNNTANGYQALHANTTGRNNTASGYDALLYNTTGRDNTANGLNALYYNTTGNSNTAIGAATLLDNITGSENTCVGYNSNTSLSWQSNATALGHSATVNASNKVRIGSSAVSIIEGQVGYSHPSDGRFKENVKDDIKGLEFINKLQPVSYNFNRLKFAQHMRERITDGKEDILIQQSQSRSVGFIAQEVEKIIQQTGFTSFDAVHAPTNETDNYSMGYAEFVVPLVKAVQELSARNDAQDILIKNLASEIQYLKSNLKQSPIQKFQPVILFQNSPNPFSSETEIRFQLPDQFKTARLVISDASGRQMRTYNLQSSASVIVMAGELPAGIYAYSLIIDENTVESKQMVLTR